MNLLRCSHLNSYYSEELSIINIGELVDKYDFKIEEVAHSESHDAGRGPSIQHKVHGAGEAGTGEYRAFCDVNPVNFDNSTWRDLG